MLCSVAGPQISCSCYSPDPGGAGSLETSAGVVESEEQPRMPCVCVCVCVNVGEKIQKETRQYFNTPTPASSQTRVTPSLDPWQHLGTLGLSQLAGEGV